jgi:hypothetical protein
LTRAYLHRIGEIDRSGPGLNSVIELNPMPWLSPAKWMSNADKKGRGVRCMAFLF